MSPPTVTLPHDTLDVSRGERVRLVCRVEGWPRPQVTWFHNGIRRDGGDHNRQGSSELTLPRARPADSGLYQCWASNLLGQSQGTITLAVTHGNGNNGGGGGGGGKSFEEYDEENVEGDRKLPSRKLGRVDKKKNNGRRRNMNMRTRDRKNKKQGGGGDVGKPKYVPSAPFVTQLSDRSVMVNWTVVDKGNGQTIQFFKVQYKMLSPKKDVWKTCDINLQANERRYEVKELKSGGSYKFRVMAVYEDGDNKGSANSPLFRLIVQAHTQPSSPDTSPTIVEAEPIVWEATFGMAIKWQYIAESASPIEGFVILYKVYSDPNPFTELVIPEAGIRSHVLRDMKPGTNYAIKMQSFNEAGRSQLSNQVVKATKKDREIHNLPFNNPTMDFGPDPYGRPNPPIGPILEDTDSSDLANDLQDSSSDSSMFLIVGIILGTLLLALIVMVVMCWWRHQQGKRGAPRLQQHKFQDQSQCIYSDANSHTKPNGSLYPPANGGPPVYPPANGGGPHLANGRGPPHGHTRMNIDVNPLAEYDMQTSSGGDRRPPMFYGNHSNGQAPHPRYQDPPRGPHSSETVCVDHGGHSSSLCVDHGGQPLYPLMQHRTLPLAPPHMGRPATGSLGRPSLNHEYSEPHEREPLTREASSGIPSNYPGSGSSSVGGYRPNGVGVGGGQPLLMNSKFQQQNNDYEWAANGGSTYDQPISEASGSSTHERLSPAYHTAGHFSGNPVGFPPQRVPSSLTSGSSRGQGVGRSAEQGCHGPNKHKRRRKRASGEPGTQREFVMRDQATNTDISSNEGNFEFYCKSGSSSSGDLVSDRGDLGSDRGDLGCDSNWGNNGSVESINDSACSDDSREATPLATLATGVGTQYDAAVMMLPLKGSGVSTQYEPPGLRTPALALYPS